MQRIALVGLPGSGKSTLGKQLARRLGVDFFDSDQLVEQRIGCSIRAFFEREGELRFRDIEELVVGELATANTPAVLALGGGAILRSASRVRLHKQAHVLYLHCSPDDIFSRLRNDVKRPLLQVDDPLSRLRCMYVERDPLYREVAHTLVEIGRPSIPKLLINIVMQLELTGVLGVRHTLRT